jgi:hypothetical protein
MSSIHVAIIVTQIENKDEPRKQPSEDYYLVTIGVMNHMTHLR